MSLIPNPHSLVEPPCWIIHQPEDKGNGVIADMQSRDVMFRTKESAMKFWLEHLLFREGFVCERFEDSSDWKHAAECDGRSAVWYEDAVFGGTHDEWSDPLPL